MNHTARIARPAAIALVASALAASAGCSVRQQHAFDATAPYATPFVYASYLSAPDHRLGPSLVAGDTLAFQIVLAGGYDLPPDAPRFAAAPVDAADVE